MISKKDGDPRPESDAAKPDKRDADEVVEVEEVDEISVSVTKPQGRNPGSWIKKRLGGGHR